MSECSWFFWTCDRNSGCSCLTVCPFWVDYYICLPTLTWGQWVVMAACHCQLFMIRWHSLRLCEAIHMRLWLHSLSCYLQKNLLSRFLCNDVFELLVLQFHEVSIGVWCVIFKLMLWRFLCNFIDISELLCALISQGSIGVGCWCSNITKHCTAVCLWFK
jgi:hypothetical protein